MRVNAVAPSLAMHANLAKVTSDELLEELSAREAFGRPAEPWEVAQRDRVPRVGILRLHDRRERVSVESTSLGGDQSWNSASSPACTTRSTAGPTETEQDVLRAELAVVQAADRSGFKYVWVTEHHFLDEYSHLSANEAWMAYALAITDNIHIGSGIINITPPICHPARVAEKVAMLDQLAPGRFEFGTGRGSSSTEVLGFGIESMDITREMYDEAAAADHRHDGPRRVRPLRGQVLLAATPPGAAEAGHLAAPADLGGGRFAGHVREGGPHGASACCASASPAPRR